MKLAFGETLRVLDLQSTGMAGKLIDSIGDMDPSLLIPIFYVLAAVLTEMVSNHVMAVLLSAPGTS